jgi:hypothetical protein
MRQGGCAKRYTSWLAVHANTFVGREAYDRRVFPWYRWWHGKQLMPSSFKNSWRACFRIFLWCVMTSISLLWDSDEARGPAILYEIRNWLCEVRAVKSGSHDICIAFTVSNLMLTLRTYIIFVYWCNTYDPAKFNFQRSGGLTWKNIE